jgi:tRNA (guanine-N7-)-methyltransferase
MNTNQQDSSTPISKRKRHRMHGNPFTLFKPIEMPDWSKIFSNPTAPLALDIGCGPGQFTLGLAQKYPHWNVLGLEIREHFVEEVRNAAIECKLTNLYALLANANTHLENLIPDQSVVFASVNFPDPWFKKRHQKRRVINTELLTLLHKKMKPNAAFHLMTDHEPIAREASLLFEADPLFKRMHSEKFSPHSTTSLDSEREATHTERGDAVYRLQYAFCP